MILYVHEVVIRHKTLVTVVSDCFNHDAATKYSVYTLTKLADKILN